MTGNITNVMPDDATTTSKRIGFLKELVPGLQRLGLIVPADPIVSTLVRSTLLKVSGQLGYQLLSYDVRTLDDLDDAISSGLRDNVDAFYLWTGRSVGNDLLRVVASVARSGKPACGADTVWARAGLLMSYAKDPNDGFRRAGVQVAKII